MHAISRLVAGSYTYVGVGCADHDGREPGHKWLMEIVYSEIGDDTDGELDDETDHEIDDIGGWGEAAGGDERCLSVESICRRG